MIAARNVSMLYETTAGKAVWALNDVSLDIERGEFVCAVGPSGCGKTSLLNIFAGFLFPTTGDVRVDGRPIDGPDPERGVIFQDYALFPWLSVRANVEFGLRHRGMDRAERRRRAERYLAVVGLTAAADRYPFELSGGMKQRVAVARALVNHPQLLLMDEPFAAVDAMTRTGLQDELVRVWEQERCACFLITHSIAEAVYLGQRLVVMSPNPGRIKSVLRFKAPYPRDRGSAEFREAVAEVTAAMEH